MIEKHGVFGGLQRGGELGTRKVQSIAQGAFKLIASMEIPGFVAIGGGLDEGAGGELLLRAGAVIGGKAVNPDQHFRRMPMGIDGAHLMEGLVGDFKVFRGDFLGLGGGGSFDTAVLLAGGRDRAAVSHRGGAVKMEHPRGVSGHGWSAGKAETGQEEQSRARHVTTVA